MQLCVLLSALVFLLLVVADHVPPAWGQEQAEAPAQPAVVKMNANLRATPSRNGTILAVAQEGTIVQVLEQSGSWYRVKTEAGTEAWIYYTLLVPLKTPLPLQSESSPGPSPQPSKEERSPLVTEQATAPTPSPNNRSLIDIQSRPGLRRDLSMYLLTALLVSALTIIGLQLWNARTFRQRMRTLEQIAPQPTATQQLTEDSLVPSPQPSPVTAEPSPVQSNTEIIQPSAATEAPLVYPHEAAPPLLDLPVELSPLERAVFATIVERGEVQEQELRAVLDKQGFRGVLIKAVIGDIMRKTESDGPPWIRVHYAHGRYTYRLQRRELRERSNGLAVSGHIGEHKHE